MLGLTRNLICKRRHLYTIHHDPPTIYKGIQTDGEGTAIHRQPADGLTGHAGRRQVRRNGQVKRTRSSIACPQGPFGRDRPHRIKSYGY